MKFRLGALLAIAVLVGTGCQQAPPPEVYGRLPAFSLLDHTGVAVTSDALAGRAVLLNFVYTHCTDICPVLSSMFSQAQRKLADAGLLGSRVQLLSVTVDPDHDTAPVLAEYAGQFKAEYPAWRFVTGDWDQVYDMVTGLKLATRPPRPAAGAPPPGGTELAHSARIILVDPQGQVRGYIDGHDATADELVAAVRRVLP